jgi:hypothetical protein
MFKYFFLLYSICVTPVFASEDEVKEAQAVPLKSIASIYYDQADGALNQHMFAVDSTENGGRSETLECFMNDGGQLVDKANHNILTERGENAVIPIPEGKVLSDYIQSITVKPRFDQVLDETREPPLFLNTVWFLDFYVSSEEDAAPLLTLRLYPSFAEQVKRQVRVFVGSALREIGPTVDLSLTLEGNNVYLQDFKPFWENKLAATYIADRISSEYQPTPSMKEKEWKAVVEAIAENDQGALGVLYQPGFIKEAFSFAVKNNYWGPFALLMPIIASIRVSVSDGDNAFIGFAQRIVLESHKTAYPIKWRWQKIREWIAQQTKEKKKPASTYRREGGVTTVENPAFVHPKKADTAVDAPPPPPPVRGSPRRASEITRGAGGAGAVAPQTPPVRRSLPSTPRPSAPPAEEEVAAAKKETPPPSPAVSPKRSSRSMLPNDAKAKGQAGEDNPEESSVLPGVPTGEG